MKSKAAQIADFLNSNNEAGADYYTLTQKKAAQIGVGVYWMGTSSDRSGKSWLEVFQLSKTGDFQRKIGDVCIGADGVWRS